MKQDGYGKEIIPHPRPQLLMEAGIGHHASEEGNCEKDGHPYLQGGGGTENRECYLESTVWEKVRFIWFSQTKNSQMPQLC